MSKMNKKTNAKRITGITNKRNFLAGKTVRKDSLGKECFADYFTDESASSFSVKSPKKSAERFQTSPVIRSNRISNGNDSNLNLEVSRPSNRDLNTPKISNKSSMVAKRLSAVSFSTETAKTSSPRKVNSQQKAPTRLSYDREEEEDDDDEDPVKNRQSVRDISDLKRAKLYETIRTLPVSKQTEQRSSPANSSKFAGLINDDDLEIVDEDDFLRLDLRSTKSKRAKEVEQEVFSDEDSEDSANDLNKEKSVRNESIAEKYGESSNKRLTESKRKQPIPKKLTIASDSESSEDDAPKKKRSFTKKRGSASRVSPSKSSLKTKEQSLNITTLKRDKSRASKDAELETDLSDEEEVPRLTKSMSQKNDAKNSTLINNNNVSPKWPSPWKVVSIVAEAGEGSASYESDSDSDFEPSKASKSVRSVPSPSRAKSVRSPVKSKAQSPLDKIASASHHSPRVSRSPSKLASFVKRNSNPSVAEQKLPNEFLSPKVNLTKPVRRTLLRPSLELLHLETSANPETLATSWGTNRFLRNSRHTSLRSVNLDDADTNVQRRSSRLQSQEKVSYYEKEEELPKSDSSTNSSVFVAKRKLTRSNDPKNEDGNGVSPPKSPLLRDGDITTQPGPSRRSIRLKRGAEAQYNSSEPKTVTKQAKRKITDESDNDSDSSFHVSPNRVSGGAKMQHSSPEPKNVATQNNGNTTDESSEDSDAPRSKSKTKSRQTSSSNRTRITKTLPKSTEKSKKAKEKNVQSKKKTAKALLFTSDDDSVTSENASEPKTRHTKLVQSSLQKKEQSKASVQKEPALLRKSVRPTVDEQQPGPSGIKQRNKQRGSRTAQSESTSVSDEGGYESPSSSTSLVSIQYETSSSNTTNKSKPRNSLYSRGHLKRNRIPVLEYWRNQRPIYKRNSAGTFSLVEVDDGFDPIPGYETILEMKKKKGNVKKRANPHKAVVLNESDESDEGEVTIPNEDYVRKTLRPIAVLNPMDGDVVYIDCLRVKNAYRFTSATGDEVRPEDDIIVAKPLRQKAFSTGEIILKPGVEKGMHFLIKDTMVFWVFEGTLEITIHETTFIVKKEDSFFVPLGNKYNMRNLSKTSAKLIFFQLRGG